MLRIGTISPHSQSATITEIIEECQKVGWNGALGPSQELSLSDWGTSAFWKLLVNAITFHRAVAEKCCIQLKILLGL